MISANITSIKRFAVHDGDGIRTTLFFKGCPLKCVWCHNPETINPGYQFAFYKHKCINCGLCAQICDCHVIKNDLHVIERNKCIMCRKCVERCPQEALEIFGKRITVDEAFEIIMKDKDFYFQSGGGITLSGGECLLQSEFCTELLKNVKHEGIHTAVDTCGFVSQKKIDKVLPYTDIFLYDIKCFDEALHIKLTGHSNEIILKNLKYLDEKDKKIEIRIPYVPGYNSGEIDKIFEMLQKFKNITKVRILPYHNYSSSKYEALNMENTLPVEIPNEDEIAVYQRKFDAVFNSEIL